MTWAQVTFFLCNTLLIRQHVRLIAGSGMFLLVKSWSLSHLQPLLLTPLSLTLRSMREPCARDWKWHTMRTTPGRILPTWRTSAGTQKVFPQFPMICKWRLGWLWGREVYVMWFHPWICVGCGLGFAILPLEIDDGLLRMDCEVSLEWWNPVSMLPNWKHSSAAHEGCLRSRCQKSLGKPT